MSVFEEQELKNLRRRMSVARWMRRAFAGVAMLECGASALFLDTGHAVSALPMAFAAAVAMGNVLVQTVLLRRHREQEARLLHEMRPRPDYAEIAAMEVEVWGRTFRHEGAPEEASRPRRYTWSEDGERFGGGTP